MKRIILDTDPGVDDALAFLFALAHPELQVEAVTIVAGNVGLEHTVRNGLRLLELAGKAEIPLAVGASRPLLRYQGDAADVHGSNGMSGVELPEGPKRPVKEHAMDLIIDLSHRYPGEITLVAIGPLTNVAMALMKDPALAQRLKEIVVMGGACMTYGNTTTAAEFNIWWDPDAARIVYESGAHITQIGLDVTRHARLDQSHVAELLRRRPGQISQFVHDILESYFERAGAKGTPWINMHDPLTVAVVAQPDLVETQLLRVDVETQSPLTAGMTLADLRPYRPAEPKPNVYVATKVDGDRFTRLYLDTLVG